MKLVSVIIPVYNRANLLAYTLDSIAEQTYTNWECIIVDDGSVDDTLTIAKSYENKDSRFKVFTRPNYLTKGANSCRNFGFKKVSGEYIKWFDSDDLMEPKHIEISVEALEIGGYDFVISDSINFITGKEINQKPYSFDRGLARINMIDFAKNRIGWITDDFLGRYNVLRNLSYNEDLIDGQEYNFFTRFLSLNTNGIFLNEILTKRRLHVDSLTSQNAKDLFSYKKIVAEIKILTAYDLNRESRSENKLIEWYLSGYIIYSYELSKQRIIPPYFYKASKMILRFKGFMKVTSFISGVFISYLIKRGYVLFTFSRS